MKNVDNKGKTFPKSQSNDTQQHNMTRLLKRIKRHWQLYLIILLPLVYLILFCYVPLWGSQIAFRNFTFKGGITGSEWVGLAHFEKFFASPQFVRLLKNTLGLSFYNIAVGIFPPIILAVALNYAQKRFFKKTVQIITYMPYFISTVLIVGILSQFLSMDGIINKIIERFGGEKVLFLGSPAWFKSLYVLSGVWQGTGYGAVVYIAALANVPPEHHEAAIVDGASIWQRIRYVDVPSIIPIAVMLLIMNCGKVLSIGYEKVLLMQNQMNMQTSDIISTYTYRIGLQSMQFSYSTAIGLFQSVVSLIMLLVVNRIAKRLGETSLW